jgi:two-component system sensor histidine kinase/response regulator
MSESVSEPILDLEDALNRVEGDREFYLELVGDFEKEYPKHLQTMREAIINKSAETLGKAAHTAKGALANLSAKRAAVWALALEKAGKSGNFEGIAVTLAELEDAATKFFDEIRRLKE